MSVSLVKGQKINLSKEVAGLKKVVVGLGWDAAKQGLFGHKPNIDCDASAIILGKGNKYRGVVYYGDRSAENGVQGRVQCYNEEWILWNNSELEKRHVPKNSR